MAAQTVSAADMLVHNAMQPALRRDASWVFNDEADAEWESYMGLRGSLEDSLDADLGAFSDDHTTASGAGVGSPFSDASTPSAPVTEDEAMVDIRDDAVASSSTMGMIDVMSSPEPAFSSASSAPLVSSSSSAASAPALVTPPTALRHESSYVHVDFELFKKQSQGATIPVYDGNVLSVIQAAVKGSSSIAKGKVAKVAAKAVAGKAAPLPGTKHTPAGAALSGPVQVALAAAGAPKTSTTLASSVVSSVATSASVPSITSNTLNSSIVSNVISSTSVSSPSSNTTVNPQAVAVVVEMEKKRPGRKRLQMPSDEDLSKVVDPKERKRLQNRKASRECRQRKQNQLGALETEIQDLRKTTEELSGTVEQLREENCQMAMIREENIRLKQQLAQFERQFGALTVC